MKLVIATFLALCQNMATADMYMQFPGGGNNRLNEPNRARRNNNRLFDSQNNNRFGHNQAGHYFFTQSVIDMQWTVQHSCGPESNVNCEVVLQYACDDQLRDGQSVWTIPNKASDCADDDCDSDFKFGMHENYESYQYCSLRERNKGLFPADRRIRGNNARYTRQEERGTRYGYECNEERDHYPYWNPTIWRDIAVFTDDTSRCEYYKTESENVKGRSYCKVDKAYLDANYNPWSGDAKIPITKEACDAFDAGNWTDTEPHKYPNGKSLEAPECLPAPYQRDNHHGNGDDRYFVGYKWKIPEDLVHASCTVRIRYNMTSSDFDGWTTTKETGDISNRMSERQGTYVGKCYGLGEGGEKFATIGGVYFSDRGYNMTTATEISPRWDKQVVLTRESTATDNWNVTTLNRWGARAIGWQHWHLGYKKVRFSFDIKFRTKPTSGSYGALFFNQWERDWVNDAPLNEWKSYSFEKILPRSGGWPYSVGLVFDRAAAQFEIANYTLCVVDELAELAGGKNPFSEIQDAFDWGPYEARQRGYQHRNDARIKIFDKVDMRLRMAYNTDQLGRTFEDRSHKLKFVQLPADIKAEVDSKNLTVWNLNARGKIGNNVEVYPAFEYDYAPKRIEAKKGDYLHIQFSGSNTNDGGNDHSHMEPNGDTVRVLRGKDRHNMVAIDSYDALRPSTDITKLHGLFGFSEIVSMCIAFGGVHGGDNEYLQSAGAYFDNELRQLNLVGKHMAYAPINTRHGVRSQKAKVFVSE